MISEGTDIPRLQVCCYLSRIRTELHYRQVLGRVLRRMGELDDQAWLLMPAEPTLKRFAERIADDLPEDLAILSQVQMPAAEYGSMAGGKAATNDTDGSSDDECGRASGKGSGNAYSLSDFAPEATCQLSFSHYYGQQLLACF